MTKTHDIHTPDAPRASYEDERRRARRAVVRRATDVREARHFLDMLGLAPIEGERP